MENSGIEKGTLQSEDSFFKLLLYKYNDYLWVIDFNEGLPS